MVKLYPRSILCSLRTKDERVNRLNHSTLSAVSIRQRCQQLIRPYCGLPATSRQVGGLLNTAPATRLPILKGPRVNTACNTPRSARSARPPHDSQALRHAPRAS